MTSVAIPADEGHTILAAELGEPAGQPDGAVIFAHGSGSSRLSPRNLQVAETLRVGGFRTLLVDLLTEDEYAVDIRTREHRFDIPKLARRVVATVDWHSGESPLPIGLFGASTGAAAALIAAAERPDQVRAVVSRGGRPDLAGAALPNVQAPTRLIVGGADTQVIELNRRASNRMNAEVDIAIVPGAGHLFEEPGALETVGELAHEWFRTHLRRQP